MFICGLLQSLYKYPRIQSPNCGNHSSKTKRSQWAQSAHMDLGKVCSEKVWQLDHPRLPPPTSTTRRPQKGSRYTPYSLKYPSKLQSPLKISLWPVYILCFSTHQMPNVLFFRLFTIAEKKQTTSETQGNLKNCCQNSY